MNVVTIVYFLSQNTSATSLMFQSCTLSESATTAPFVTNEGNVDHANLENVLEVYNNFTCDLTRAC